MKNRYVILGSSRGLGWALFQELLNSKPDSEFLLSSRKINESQIQNLMQVQLYKCDFSVTPISNDFLNVLQKFKPTHIVYCAGGGPYGVFQSKKWSDHLWALNVNFLFPTELLHQLCSHTNLFPDLKTITFVGSRIAESQPDKMASSYSAAKHGLKGLVTTVQAEQKEKNLPFKVKLFSPGYMLTDLLPVNSPPRLENKALSPERVASLLSQFIASNEELG